MGTWWINSLEFSRTLLYSHFQEFIDRGFGFSLGRFAVKKIVVAALIIFTISLTAFSQQSKGEDPQRERVRDNSSEKTAAKNGNKRDTGTGRGMDWGKGKSPKVLPLDNPYRLSGRRDVILKAVADVMRDRKLILDEGASRPAEGILVSQPYRFIKGAVVSQSELGRYADVPSSTTRGWTQGRYTITVEVQPIDGSNANVSVNAKIEGRSDGATGAEWATLPSLGVAEDEFLAALIEKVTGSAPPGRALSPEP
jgi:hypothetical protein